MLDYRESSLRKKSGGELSELAGGFQSHKRAPKPRLALVTSRKGAR